MINPNGELAQLRKYWQTSAEEYSAEYVIQAESEFFDVAMDYINGLTNDGIIRATKALEEEADLLATVFPCALSQAQKKHVHGVVAERRSQCAQS